MEGNLEFGPERRRFLRQKVHAPAYASFDGVSGGMILDLSEEGLSMQMGGGFDGYFPASGSFENQASENRSSGSRSSGNQASGNHSSGNQASNHHSADNPGSNNYPLQRGRRVRMELELGEGAARVTPSKLETTGYIAWADALGRAGVRFSDLPEESRRRLNEWLAVNASAPSHTAPKVALGWPRGGDAGTRLAGGDQEAGDHLAISLEAEESPGLETEAGSFDKLRAGPGARPAWAISPWASLKAKFAARDAARVEEPQVSGTVQYEFNSLGTDLAAALRLIGERARVLTRGTSAAIALAHKGSVICRASVGESAPALGTRLDVNSGLAGECLRTGKALRCDDAEHDARVDLESCRRLGVRSIVAAPVRYERDTIGLLMVLAAEPFCFDEGDIAVVESLAHTVVRSMRQAEVGRGLAAG